MYAWEMPLERDSLAHLYKGASPMKTRVISVIIIIIIIIIDSKLFGTFSIRVLLNFSYSI